MKIKVSEAKANSLNLEPETFYQPKKFSKKNADKITNFNPASDTIEIDSESFEIGISAKLKAAKNKRQLQKLAKQDFDFLYDQKKGGLYFNENRAEQGWGDRGIFAIIKGATDISTNNLDFI